MSNKSEDFFNEFLEVCSKFFTQLQETCEKHRTGRGGGSKGHHVEEKKVKKKIFDPLKGAPNAPKKPIIQAYLLYYTEVRSQKQQDNPNVQNKDLTKIIADEWNKLTREKKTPYEERAKANRDQYEEAVKAYLETNPELKAIMSLKKKKKRSSAASVSSQSKPVKSNGKNVNEKAAEPSSDESDGEEETVNGKREHSSSDNSSDDSDDDSSAEDSRKKIKK